jgi:hypothetical protein
MRHEQGEPPNGLKSQDATAVGCWQFITENMPCPLWANTSEDVGEVPTALLLVTSAVYLDQRVGQGPAIDPVPSATAPHPSPSAL